MTARSPVRYQTPVTARDRTDHVWVEFMTADMDVRFKCCLCGMVVRCPPPYPTPKSFVCVDFEPLTDADRALCPYTPKPADV